MNSVSHFARHLYWLLLCSACLLRSGLVTAQEELAVHDDSATVVARVDVIKSENDDREYRYITLQNKLRVLLISDADAEKSAAALDVFIGHNQNPADRQGLAHFLEHMLFLGTEKYPEAGEYQAFISQHGGNHNAFTAPEHTNYFFDIDSDYLDPALDRFAQFFIAPLFDAGYVERERNAVHSEYLARINDDGRRILDVYRELLNPEHPAAQFSVGSQETLADREGDAVRDDLIAFYRQYYSADAMTLVVLGKESLDELQKMVVGRFGAISSHPRELPDAYPALFPADFLPAAVSIKPEKELRQLSMLFPIPNPWETYSKKPWHYIGNLLGHEGKGSVLSLLKDLGWAEGLSAGVGSSTRHDAFFQITIQLTEKGTRARDQIVPLMFYMIEQLQVRGLKDWRYNELKELADIDFRFHEQSPPIDTVKNLAYVMHIYQPQDVLRGDYLYTAYDEKLIQQGLSYLRNDNVMTVFVAPDVETDKLTHFYQTPYAVEKIKFEEYEIKPSVRKKLYFPEPNAFIPTRLAVKSQLLLPTPSESAAPRIADRPQMVIRNERTQAWFKQDQQFHVPKAKINLRLKLPLVAMNAEGAAQAQLFAALVMDELNEFSYPASLAGLHYAVRANTRGLDISIDGYSSRQGLLLSKIAKAIRKGRFNQERFTNLKQELIRNWRNEGKNTPYIVLARQIPVLHYEPYWSNEALINGLESKTLEQFHQFSTRLLRDGTMEALLYGNLFRQEAIKLAALAEYELLGTKTGRPQPAARLYQLSTKQEKPWLYRHTLDHNDRVVQLYIQSLQPSIVDTAHMKLLQQMLQPAFFDRLRTEKQLGYIVSVFPMPIRNLEGMVFVVQSPAADEAQIVQEIDSFLTDYAKALGKNLAENKQSLVRDLKKPARTLTEQADIYWESILLEDEEFDRRQQIAAAVAGVTEASLNNYYQRVILEKQRRLWLTSQKMSDTENFHLLNNLEAYHQQLDSLVYP